MAQRKIRVGKQKPGPVVQATRPAMTPSQVLTAKITAAEIQDQELLDLIDAAYEWDVEQKRLAKIVKAAKTILLQSAKATKWKSRAGSKAECAISPSTTSTVGTATEFAKLLKKEGKIKLFDDMVKVQIGEAKKYLGEDALADFVETDTEDYGKVALKKL